MRPLVLAIAAIWLFAAPQASAGPACWDKSGVPIRCGAPGAMPVGWYPPRDAKAPPSQFGNLWKAACIIGAFLCAIALLPEFDGTRNEDWERKDE